MNNFKVVKISYKICRYCGHKPLKQPLSFCSKCGKPYKEVYSKNDTEPTGV